MEKETNIRLGKVDSLIKILPQVWSFLKDNVTVLSIIITLVGALNQVSTLLWLNPSLVNFYSPGQGLLDGVLYLVFFLTVSLVYYWFIIIFNFLRRKANIDTKITFFIVTYTLLWLITTVLLKWNIPVLNLLLLLPAAILPVIFSTGNRSEISEDDESEKTTALEIHRFLFYVAIFHVITTFISFNALSTRIKIHSFDKVSNYNLIENTMNINAGSKYEVIYINNLYLFLQDTKTKRYVVVKNVENLDEITKLQNEVQQNNIR
ncbi:hypothetical protein [Kaistella faecalis]|uniref:hypothetical protein n=1 Tax=Kaistella faecalis TaxID=2852098 RepID=UPI001C4702ED|nr:hypothetical protein [Chryseobacterium faecale]UFK98244.1 hypothetical protein LL667_02535 [Chryseobacterium faecale]